MALEPATPTEAILPSPEWADYLHRWKVGLVFTLPLVMFAMLDMVSHTLIPDWLTVAYRNTIQFLLASPVVFWSGYPLFKKGWRSLKSRNLNMFTLIALGTSAAYLFSTAATFFPLFFPAHFFEPHGGVGVYFESCAMIVELVLLGQILELSARAKTGSAIQALLKLTPKTARKVSRDGTETDVPVEIISVQDFVRVRPGETIPVDGILITGAGSIDESMLTGESMPVDKSAGEKVSAGTLNLSGSFLIQAKSVGQSTLISQIVKMVAEAQRSPAPIQRLADQVSSYFVPLVMAVSLMTAVLWFFFGPEPSLSYALVNAVAVLIIACPCALGLATPMSVMVGTGRGAEAGVLIREAQSLELLEKVNLLVIDKTGTLTEGKPRLMSLQPVGPFSETELFSFAVPLERGSEHPLATAILQAAKDKGIDPQIEISDFKALPGKGVKGTVAEKALLLGNHRFLEECGVSLDSESLRENTLRDEGQTVLYLAVENRLAGIFSLSDTIKDSAPNAIQELKAMGIEIVMLTGDHLSTAKAVAKTLGIETVIAGVLPQEKRSAIIHLKNQGKVVAMAGDGVNDAPALAVADVGIAMGKGGTDVAHESADVVLMRDDLSRLAGALRLAKRSRQVVWQNLVFAFTVIATLVVFTVLGEVQLTLGVIGHEGSTLLVVANGLRLLWPQR